MELYKGKNFDVVFVDWRQGFVGQCIVSSNKESLSKLSDEDWKELERISEKLFNATMFNFACLINNAYRAIEKPHVHFHFIPRYKNELKLFNKIYKYKHFGYNF